MSAVVGARPTRRLPPPARLLHRHRLTLVAGAAIFVGTLAAQYKPLARAILGLAAMLVFAVVATVNRKLALTLAVVGLVLLGFVRRLLIPFAGWNPQDPLLLLSPACAVILWIQGARGRALPRSALASLGLVLLLWAGAETFNPAESSLVVGAQAALFWVTPFLWFFAGRTLGEEEHRTLLTTVFWVGIVVIAHGLYQTFFGLLPFEYTWLDHSGPGAAIFLEGFKIRPFSTLVSPQEYGFFMSLLVAVILSRVLHGKRNMLVGAYLMVAIAALFLQGTRQVFALFVVATAVMVIVRIRSAGIRLVIVATTVFVLFTMVPRVIGSEPRPASVDDDGGTTASLLATHQVEGFTDPMSSTLPLHVDLIVEGFEASFSHPFGVGTGKTSIAVGKAGKEGVSTENDVASVFAALGPAGGVLYVAFIGLALFTTVRLYLRDRTAMHLAWVGMGVAHLTQWWSGTLYATTSILFMTLGGIAAARLTETKSSHPPPLRKA